MAPVADDDVISRLEKAAIEAEYRTGVHEDTEAEAKAHIVIRIARMSLGATVTILGVVLLPLPGPGWLIIAAGLAILAQDAAWADRLLRYVRRRVPGVPEDGKIPRSTIATLVTVSAAITAFALWWSLGRG